MKTTHRSIAASLLAAFLLSPAAGSAVPPAPSQATSPAPPQADTLSRTAHEMLAKGAEAWNQRRYDACRAWLLAAWSIKPHRQIAGNLAACEIKLGLFRDAAEHLSFLTQATADGKRGELSPEHRRLFDDALSKIAVLNIDAEPGATVLIDGKAVGQAPLSAPVYLEPGTHTLEARSRSGSTAEFSRRFEAGAQKTLTLHPPMPNAEVAPPPPPPAPAAAPPPPVAPAPPPDTRVRDGVVIGGLALGGAAVAAGVVLAIVSNGKSEDAEDAVRSMAKDGGMSACKDPAFRARCDALADTYIAKGTTRNLAIAAFATAGAALGGAAIASVLWPVGAPQAEAGRGGVHLAPRITAQGAGLTIGGAF
ncbi:uncharacterized protein SOCEGT47_046620 [Sorangium cellulosum]|uniref:Uncharacterized protein n=1 Tax=Sorangium cellulosum TaxID=56 RepID=A0A4P2Q501_SORCE|nr:PEGA domain-containing protein [Sorangium cellulosum]AUX24126.1 uncharacterized protein SOCEGT47_046620 [Sorangium cellulosum]